MNWRSTLSLLLLAALPIGCADSSPDATVRGQEMFKPVEMKLHPVFTKVNDWTGDGKPDGIEALVELRDSFGDTTKSAGLFIFELYSYQPNSADPRGPRVMPPWQAPVDSAALQKQQWSRTNRCYAFRLEFPGAKDLANYVLTATFTPTGGDRLFDQIILGPDPSAPPSTQPARK